ncbi:menaquinone-dependent protoporphyrinogen IX dehydrogenase [Endozoicomonas numazuensis]|uniref:menaquinone-dependent protoporphyrinogen IX dehydrogenase n=1 Tax=Endozoicomonas numazuensis TaxID=1137799 RepID=UPI00068C1464|nr:menaquinone-dependent protoporphyrinogen IX dehydrogenase [Endozoicomonas numazuensis]
MSKIAMLFASREGQTQKIIERMCSIVTRAGHDVDMIHLEGPVTKNRLEQYEAFVLGSSVRYGQHHDYFCRFVEQNVAELNRKPCYFFSVNLTARKTNRSEPHQNPYLTKYLRYGSLRPDSVEVFAGAFKWSRYGFFQRQLLSLILRVSDGSSAPAEDCEFTDWCRVIKFAERFVQQLDSHAGQNRYSGCKEWVCA